MRGLALALVVAAALAGCGSSDVSRQLGARCDDSSECDDRCLLPADWPGGFCSVSCDTDADCPDLSVCDDAEGACLYLCDGDPACAFLGDGWVCAARPGRPSGEVMVCAGA